jgi:hypothetical protein
MGAVSYHWHICPTPPEYKINIRGRVIFFEDHPFCGPMPVTAKGMGMNLAPNHPFWTEVSKWYQQGKQVSGKNTCVWDPAIPLNNGPAPGPGAIVLKMEDEG